MSVMCTTLAVSRLQNLVTEHKSEVRDLVKRVRNLQCGSDILSLPNSYHLGGDSQMNIYVYPMGPWRVILATTIEKPDTVFVADILSEPPRDGF